MPVGWMPSVAVIAAAAAAAFPAGDYETRQMEMAGALQVTEDGKFRYALEYGALSETAEGRWGFDGTTLRLTTEPKPRPPKFELVRDDPAPVGHLSMVLEGAPNWPGPLTALAVEKPGSEPFEISAGEEGRVDLQGKSGVASVAPLVPIYGTAGEPVTLSPNRGHRLTFRFVPNALGVAAFESEPMVMEGDAFIMRRHQTEIRFVRIRP